MAGMDPGSYLDDVERIPQTLGQLADALDRGLIPLELVRPAGVDRVLLLGMGSSAYAANVVAARLRAAGVMAVAEFASSPLLPPPTPGTLVLAVPSGGGGNGSTARLPRHVAARSGGPAAWAGRVLGGGPRRPARIRAAVRADVPGGTTGGRARRRGRRRPARRDDRGRACRASLVVGAGVEVHTPESSPLPAVVGSFANWYKRGMLGS